MYHAYVLKSINHDYYYKGSCEDLGVRLQQHNAGMTRCNRKYAPFQIAYSESFLTQKEAILREKYFKSAAGRRYLKSKLFP